MLKNTFNTRSLRFFRGSISSIFKREIHSQLLSRSSNGVHMYQLVNDRDEYTHKNFYVVESLKQMRKLLKQNYYYIYVDKGKLSVDGDLYPGHVASFFTDADGKIVEDSCVSLRRGKKIENQELVYTLSHDVKKRQRTVSVWKIKFISFDSEFEDNFLKHAEHNVPGKERYLIEIPFSLLGIDSNELIKNTKSMKEKYITERFILCNGKIGKESVQALNCVKGFYGSHKLRGTVENPSPQMSAWSYLNFIMGFLLRDEVINSTGLRVEGIERTIDDMLEYDKGFDSVETVSRFF